MTKDELIAELASRSDVTKAAAAKVLDNLTGLVLERAHAGQETHIHRFGTFDRHDKPARKGRNPKTGESIPLDAVSVLRFKPSKSTRDELN